MKGFFFLVTSKLVSVLHAISILASIFDLTNCYVEVVVVVGVIVSSDIHKQFLIRRFLDSNPTFGLLLCYCFLTMVLLFRTNVS